MEVFTYFWIFLNLILSSFVTGNGLYFPISGVNVSIPTWRKLPKPLPPLMKLYTTDADQDKEDGVKYSIVSETTSGLFLVEGDELKLNENFFSSGDVVSKHQSVIVSGLFGTESVANASINLVLTGDKINCERAKRNLCFWNGASYEVFEEQRPTQLGHLSSLFYLDFCKNYSVSYNIFKGGDYVKVNEKGILYTKREIKGEIEKIGIGVNCTITTPTHKEFFLKEFNLNILKRERLQTFFQVLKIPPSNEFSEGEKVATGIINDPGGSKVNFLKISLVNDTEHYFYLNCLPKVVKTFPKTSYYDCEITARKAIRLDSSYSAFVRIEDTSLLPGDPNRFILQNITLQPTVTQLKKDSLSTYSDESIMPNLKYPESAEISRKAVGGSRVVEPFLEGSLSNTQQRKRIVESKLKFGVLSRGPFNVTEMGGIVFVTNRNALKENTYKIKITGVYPNGYRFFFTVQINVTDTNSSSGDEICGKEIDEKTRPSCSEKRFRSECEKTCGVSSGILTRNKGRAVTAGCSWRHNEKPEMLSREYQTCSPDLSTCPDRFCDPLEALFPKSCPQDCTEYVFGSANKDSNLPGITSATGVCTCDNRKKCLCSLATASDTPRQNEKKKVKQNNAIKTNNKNNNNNNTIVTRHEDVISAVKASYIDQCGTVCLLSIVGATLIFMFGFLSFLLVLHRRRVKKRCNNQRPLKEDMVNINYEEYMERPDHLRPLTQSGTVKEISEYYDKKWEFPRHRLTIEETIGEGEFGKVLKARADGIAGNDGPITVAVKTLKDNAKESELADLISEYQLLKEIDHPNVIHLLGACTKSDGPIYVIIEYAEHGSLRNYLRRHRHLSLEQLSGKESETSYVQTITPKDILTFAWQIAKGMNYLTEMKLVHRDLAARNVLIAEGLICKISDFGLTRDIYEDDTYLKRSKGRVPVKWMALESLADHIYTTKSDVWSYGVVLWELVTTGASPYPGIAGQNLFHLLKSGYRMEKPPNCSNELYQILRSCWHENPSHRPTFKSLVAKFEEMLGEGKDYLDLNPRTAENKTYFSEFFDDDDDNNNEREAFLPTNELLKFKFEMSEDYKMCNKCPSGKCSCVGLRYENEQILRKPKYQNEGMEDTGYVQPTGEPKPVNIRPSSVTETNLNLEDNKKQIFEVKKI